MWKCVGVYCASSDKINIRTNIFFYYLQCLKVEIDGESDKEASKKVRLMC